MDAHPTEWPAEPWMRGCEREADCIYQEGEAHPLVLVDPARVLTADEADNTLNRIVSCVNAICCNTNPGDGDQR